MKKIFFCKSCLAMSTRPRIFFNKLGECSACQWNKEKKKINWKTRINSLKKLCSKHKNNNAYDCIVAVSGGKDGSYVSYKLRNEFNLSPLTVIARPALETDLGQTNLASFINSGFSNICVSPNVEGMRKLNLYGLRNLGFPYYGWLIAVHSVVLRIAYNFKISLIFYSEDGEVEYGGDAKYKNDGVYNIDYIKKAYLESGYDSAIKNSNLNKEEAYWFQLPSEKELKNFKLDLTHFSFYENWDPYRNYLVAKEFCGLKEKDTLNEGTFTNFSQNDQKLYALHTYFMYLKFGFGRANQDASIEIRRGAMTREQGIQLVKLYDNQEPKHLYKDYCEYFKISEKELLDIIDKWTNKDLFEKKNNSWVPKFEII